MIHNYVRKNIKANFNTDMRVVAPSYKMGHYHSHNRWELFYLASGSCSISLKDDVYLLESGCITLIPENTPHMTTYLSGKSNDRRLVYFDTPELDWTCRQTGIDAVHIFSNGFIVKIPQRRRQYVSDIITKITYEHKDVDDFSESFVRAYFNELMLFLLRCHKYEENVLQKMDVSNAVIQKVIEYIIINYKNDITLVETAQKFNISESSLSKKFKAFTGYRFKEYLVNVRTHAAAELLANTALSITDIALRCGFSDSNTFGDTFKRVFSMSPSSYRKNI